MNRHAQGILLIALSAVAYSSVGFFTRLIHLDAWTMLFWRGWFAGLMILCVIVMQERQETWRAIQAIGRPGLVVAACSTAATILYINAFRRTSVADAAVIFAAAPFVTASFAALLGVGIMVAGAITDGHLVGDLLALGMTVCMAIMMLILRQQHETPMLPAACLSALLCPLLVWPFAAPFEVTTGDMVTLFLFGTMQFGLGLIFLTLGGRLISATENALINTLEAPLTIGWVWVTFGEAPTAPMSGMAVGSRLPMLPNRAKAGTTDAMPLVDERESPDPEGDLLRLPTFW
jgi:drug/metabolite transporter (DMT)-like permease